MWVRSGYEEQQRQALAVLWACQRQIDALLFLESSTLYRRRGNCYFSGGLFFSILAALMKSFLKFPFARHGHRRKNVSLNIYHQ